MARTELRLLQDLGHRVWSHDPGSLNFEASFGMLAWERGDAGECVVFERAGAPVGWARLVPGYERIREAGVWDRAPASLVCQVDSTDVDRAEVTTEIVRWAMERSDEVFTAAHNDVDDAARTVLSDAGFIHDATEPYSGYLVQPLAPLEPTPPPAGYRIVTMAQLDDPERRAEVHRRAWEGSTRTAADVEATMATWPYQAELDLIAIADDGSLAGSALCWFDPVYTYGEFEPVGTAPDHRGAGVGAALLRSGLQRLRDAGATDAVVGARADPAYPAPRRLYRSVGFADLTTQRIVRSPS